MATLLPLVVAMSLAQVPTHEVHLAPIVQLNGKFSHHAGTTAVWGWRWNQALGLRVAVQNHWQAEQSAFNRELLVKVKEVARPATSALVRHAAFAGLGLRPFQAEVYGKRVDLALDIGAGAAWLGIELAVSREARTVADLGVRFASTSGLSVRAWLTRSVFLRAELRSLVVVSQIRTVNGCTLEDLSVANGNLRQGRGAFPADEAFSVGCRRQDFETPAEVTEAFGALRLGGSDTLHVQTFGLGAGVNF